MSEGEHRISQGSEVILLAFIGAMLGLFALIFTNSFVGVFLKKRQSKLREAVFHKRYHLGGYRFRCGCEFQEVKK